MVVFTCGHCGDSVQKPTVEKHYETKCRNRYPDLCCVDCLKDFRGDDFKAHTKCVTEAERYGGKGFVAKPGQNKGERKQNAWIEIAQSVLDENKFLSGSLRNLLERVSQQPNTPRKKPKFINFVKSMNCRVNMNDVERAWELLSTKLELLKNVDSNKQQEENKEPDNSVSVKVDSSTTEEIDEPMETENAEDSVSQSKKQKKKNKKESDLNQSLENTSNDAVNAADSIKKSKKKKDKKVLNGETHPENNKLDDVIPGKENGEEIDEVTKSSKKNKVNKENHDGNADLKNTNEEMHVDNVQEAPEEKVLTKKERKEKKKREKYETQLREIETAPKVEIEETDEGNKKSRKRKLDKEVIENGTKEITPVEPDSTIKDEPVVKKSKKDAAVEFDWAAAILSVLGSKGKEISLKKLEKRVLSEFCAVNNVQDVTDRMMKKYSKSLHKIQNTKIENDKIRLVSDEE